MGLYLHNNHASSNVISMLFLKAIVANAMENCKLGDAGFDEYDLFSPPSLKEEIFFDDTMPPIYDDYNDDYDCVTPTIANEKNFAYLENSNSFMMMNEKNALCDSYIVEFAYDATESFYERKT